MPFTLWEGKAGDGLISSDLRPDQTNYLSADAKAGSQETCLFDVLTVLSTIWSAVWWHRDAPVVIEMIHIRCWMTGQYLLLMMLKRS